MTQVVGEELTHAAYRRRRRAGVDEADGAFGWRFVELEVIEEVLAVSLPLRGVT